MAKAKGRPSKYTKEIAETICLRLSEGKTLRSICRDDETLPAESTVRNWALTNLNGFFAQYAQARDIGLDAMVDDMLDIADETSMDTKLINGNETPNNEWISRSRLRIDTRKWYVSKLAPKRYGDKLTQETKDDKEIPEDYAQPLEIDETPPENTIV